MRLILLVRRYLLVKQRTFAINIISWSQLLVWLLGRRQSLYCYPPPLTSESMIYRELRTFCLALLY